MVCACADADADACMHACVLRGAGMACASELGKHVVLVSGIQSFFPSQS